ncbi:hypothetical protein DOTSEDRAFT_35079 [Dothistroma septosporum NZE10]|uniref:Uncharacterized protein n=1 Tax=Dothistroma septosporum (strain NZE10 / CBS 128990) TaxID=675120 RepID=N1PP47_DOTSN|nr:hypothetical protein DOTSEDRAFT_35079 [Dothistroma septosporum NZE10]
MLVSILLVLMLLMLMLLMLLILLLMLLLKVGEEHHVSGWIRVVPADVSLLIGDRSAELLAASVSRERMQKQQCGAQSVRWLQLQSEHKLLGLDASGPTVALHGMAFVVHKGDRSLLDCASFAWLPTM